MNNQNKTIYLISCSKTKLTARTQAKNMYTSELFKTSYNYALLNNGDVFILSAKHGLLEPSDIIDPYDNTMNGKDRDEKVSWSRSVLGTLISKRIEGAVVILAGKNYYQYLKPMLESSGYIVELPLDGLGIGQRLKYMKDKLKNGR